jgi:formylglycine-generating enzyme required for sulfatase activity
VERPALSEGEAAFCEYLRLQEAGAVPSFAHFVAAHPGLEEELERLREGFETFRPLADELQRQIQLFSSDDGEDPSFDRAWAELHAGDVIGDYKLIRPLGHGGMGEVWEVEQLSLARRLALKLVLPHRVNERALNLFAREARAGGRLAHTGIVAVHATGENEGRHWIAMELVEGGRNLAHFIDELDLDLESEPDQYIEAARIMAGVAEALVVAHDAHVIHRDLKPSNILLTPQGEAKVTDFGLAKITDEVSISHAGELMGTYFYMSPEQVAAKRAGLDARTDVFSLGVILYEMLSHQKPFLGDTTQQVMTKILFETPRDPRAIRSQVPRDLAVICAKAMEKQPERRYQSMGELASDLWRFLNHEPIVARPSSAWRRLELWGRRHPVLATAGGLMACGGLVFAFMAQFAYSGWRAAERANGELRRQELVISSELLFGEQAEALVPMAGNVRALGEAVRRAEDLEARFARERESSKGLVLAGDNATEELRGRAIRVRELLGELRLRQALAQTDRAALEGEYDSDWSETIAGVATAPAYGGLKLVPQAGLVPLGPDPDSALFEFAVPATGALPPRSAQGRLAIGPSSAVVLVLVPGGGFTMGGAAGEKTVKTRDEYPAHPVSLAPFFLSKYELSRAQFELLHGGHRSTIPVKRLGAGAEQRAWPVDGVSWEDARLALGSVGLRLPTEAQWEYAAGASAVQPLGLQAMDKAEVGAWANTADKSVPLDRSWDQDLEVDDGYLDVAPIESFRANSFGLHNMLGNLWEWTLDGWYSYGDVAADGKRRDGKTGEVSATDPHVRWARGGSYKWPLSYARASNRRCEGYRAHIDDMGVRPARMLERR